MSKATFISFASVISEIQQSDVFMTVKARICEAPQANLNGARVTEAFIDEIVSNETRYVGLPLYADVKALIGGRYNRLGHLYDSRTGEFHSTQIGSFYQFEKEKLNEGCALVGYARIPKRNKKLSKAISELFADGKLKFSFELAVGEYEELDDDTILIDASENNYLEGTAIVTFPACEEAVALQLVAQKADDRKGDAGMAEVQNLAEVQEEVVETAEAEVTAEEKDEANLAEAEDAECKKKKAEEETAEKDDEVAEVVIREGHTEIHEQCAYDTNTGSEVCQRVVVETHSSTVEDGQLVQADDGPHVAEVAEAGGDGTGESGESETQSEPAEEPVVETPASEETEPAEEPKEEPVVEEQPVVQEQPETPAAPAEQQVTAPAEVEIVDADETKKVSAEQMIAELATIVEQLKQEIAELKEQKVNAEVKTVTAEINPFVDSIQTGNTYSLLEKEVTRGNSYTLLGKA